jgi:hypothetical protein
MSDKLPAWVENLIGYLTDADPGVRRNAAERLGALGRDSEPIVGALMIALKDDADARVRAAAANALRMLSQSTDQDNNATGLSVTLEWFVASVAGLAGAGVVGLLPMACAPRPELGSLFTLPAFAAAGGIQGYAQAHSLRRSHPRRSHWIASSVIAWILVPVAVLLGTDVRVEAALRDLFPNAADSLPLSLLASVSVPSCALAIGQCVLLARHSRIWPVWFPPALVGFALFALLLLSSFAMLYESGGWLSNLSVTLVASVIGGIAYAIVTAPFLGLLMGFRREPRVPEQGVLSPTAR